MTAQLRIGDILEKMGEFNFTLSMIFYRELYLLFIYVSGLNFTPLSSVKMTYMFALQ